MRFAGDMTWGAAKAISTARPVQYESINRLSQNRWIPFGSKSPSPLMPQSVPHSRLPCRLPLAQHLGHRLYGLQISHYLVRPADQVFRGEGIRTELDLSFALDLLEDYI